MTLCNSRTRNLPEVCKQADIVVVAMGKMAAVGADCLRAGQTVVDVGIHVNGEGKLCGDVLPPQSRWWTPSPPCPAA